MNNAAVLLAPVAGRLGLLWADRACDRNSGGCATVSIVRWIMPPLYMEDRSWDAFLAGPY